LDIAQWGLGMDENGPTTIEGTAVHNADGWYETPDTTSIRYTYANGVVMTCQQKLDTKSSDQGTEFVGDTGSLFVYRGGIVANPPELLKDVDVPKIINSQANSKHVDNFLDCVKSRKKPVADVAIGHSSATVCHLGNIAIRSGKKITWDPKTETIVGDPEGAKWLTKEYRAPYKLG
jgi:predicted dehydrogenase